jgi:hypothetical protein
VPIPSGPATRPATEPAGAPASAPASEPASEPAELHGLLDPRIQTEYCVADEQLLIVAGPGVSPRMIYHQQDGSVLEAPLVLGEPRVLRVLGWPLHFTLSDVIERPLVRPEAQPADADEGVSALLVRTAGGMPFALPFRAFPDEAQPLRVPVGDALAEVTFGRTPRALGFSVTLTDFHVDTYPGGHVPRDYASRLRVRAADGAEWPAAVRLNEPADVRGLSLYQSSYEGYVDLSGRMADHAEPWTASVLSVSSKPGLWLVYVAFAGLCIGVVTSFFLDPLLRRKRREKEGDSR